MATMWPLRAPNRAWAIVREIRLHAWVPEVTPRGLAP